MGKNSDQGKKTRNQKDLSSAAFPNPAAQCRRVGSHSLHERAAGRENTGRHWELKSEVGHWIFKVNICNFKFAFNKAKACLCDSTKHTVQFKNQERPAGIELRGPSDVLLKRAQLTLCC